MNTVEPIGTVSEPTCIKEERIDDDDASDSAEYEEDAENEEDAEMITVKVDPAETESRGENGFTVYQSQLLQNFNPNQFHIAKMSHKLNTKLHKFLDPDDINSLSTAVGPNYCGVSAENRLGGDALQCSWCPANATNVEELKLHEQVCSLSPANRSTTLANAVDKDGVERNYVCDVCNKRFAKKWFLKRHYVTCSNTRPHRCVVCGEVFPSAKALKVHQITHIKDMPYICRSCNHGFPDREALREHARCHFREEPFSCRVCRKRFLEAKNLNFHMKGHQGITIFPCDECELSFASSEERAAHKEQHDVIMPFKCGLCNQSFATFRQRQRHSELHKTDTPQKCEQCDKKFSHEANYRKHVKEVHGEKSSACEECQRLANANTCRDVEELECEDCDVPFLHQECLEKHLSEHQEEKAPCVKCGREFPTVSAYHRHMLTHTGEQPYSCTDCKVCFSTRTELKEHMRKHWRDRPFACKVCGEKFSFNNMMAHLFSHAREKEQDSDEEEEPRRDAGLGGKRVLNDTANTGKDLKVNGDARGKPGGNRRRVEVIIVKTGENSEAENTPRDAEVNEKNGGKGEAESKPRDLKVKGKGKTERKHRDSEVKRKKPRRDEKVDAGKRVLNETGNIQRNAEDSGKNEAGGNGMTDERRRSQRATSQYSYFEGSSDELEEF